MLQKNSSQTACNASKTKATRTVRTLAGATDDVAACRGESPIGVEIPAAGAASIRSTGEPAPLQRFKAGLGGPKIAVGADRRLGGGGDNAA